MDECIAIETFGINCLVQPKASEALHRVDFTSSYCIIQYHDCNIQSGQPTLYRMFQPQRPSSAAKTEAVLLSLAQKFPFKKMFHVPFRSSLSKGCSMLLAPI